jgi:hypothetical protein
LELFTQGIEQRGVAVLDGDRYAIEGEGDGGGLRRSGAAQIS